MKQNPYVPGSDSWHKFNLGIQPNVIGIVEEVVVDPGHGLLVKGWFFGTVPKTMAGWFVEDDEAKLIE